MHPETKIETTPLAASDHPLQRASVQTAQLVLYPLLVVLRLVIVRNKLYRDASLRTIKRSSDKTFILYGNHQSMLDPLVICAALPFRAVRQLLPFRFFVDNAYFKGPAKGFLNIMGGFPAHYDATRAYGLDKARSLTASNQTVVIFPPGIRTREKIAKRGVSVLAAEPNVRLIPIHIDWKHRWHCHVHLGKPIEGGIACSPEQLMEAVYSLPGSRPDKI